MVVEIRKGTIAELPRILEVYQAARAFMKKTGNPDQWGDDKPTKAELIRDIELGQCHVCVQDERICGAFAFIPGIDPTYLSIYEGAWLNDKPYAAIHRVASDGTVKGLVSNVMAFAAQSGLDIRIDTHRQNKVMQHVLQKNGFTYCGIIYLQDGDERLAYQRENVKPD